MAGNATSVTNDPAVSVDLTPPTITGSLDIAPALSGWYNLGTGAPTYSYTATDDGSGLADPAGDAYTFGEGADQTHTFTVMDVAGNATSATNDPAVSVDLTPPTILGNLDIAPALSGWYNLSTGARRTATRRRTTGRAWRTRPATPTRLARGRIKRTLSRSPTWRGMPRA